MRQVSTDEIWAYNAGRVWMLVVRGDLDANLSTDLSDHLERALVDSPEDLLVDLEEVTFMDASAVGVLVGAFNRACESGAILRLVAPSAPAKRLLRLTQTEDVFPIETDLITAQARAAERDRPSAECEGIR